MQKSVPATLLCLTILHLEVTRGQGSLPDIAGNVPCDDSGFECYDGPQAMAEGCDWVIRCKKWINEANKEYYKMILKGLTVKTCRKEGNKKKGQCCPQFRKCLYDKDIPAEQNIQQCTDSENDELRKCSPGNNCNLASLSCLQNKNCKKEGKSSCDTSKNECIPCTVNKVGDCAHIASPNKHCVQHTETRVTKCMECNSANRCTGGRDCVNGICGTLISCQVKSYGAVNAGNPNAVPGSNLFVIWNGIEGHVHLLDEKTPKAITFPKGQQGIRPVGADSVWTNIWPTVKAEWVPIVAACRAEVKSWNDPKNEWNTAAFVNSAKIFQLAYRQQLPSTHTHTNTG